MKVGHIRLTGEDRCEKGGVERGLEQGIVEKLEERAEKVVFHFLLLTAKTFHEAEEIGKDFDFFFLLLLINRRPCHK